MADLRRYADVPGNHPAARSLLGSLAGGLTGHPWSSLCRWAENSPSLVLRPGGEGWKGLKLLNSASFSGPSLEQALGLTHDAAVIKKAREFRASPERGTLCPGRRAKGRPASIQVPEVLLSPGTPHFRPLGGPLLPCPASLALGVESGWREP